MAVFEASKQGDQNQNMGTTMVAALWLGKKLCVANVGDSRLYLVRNNDLTLCTVDHSFVQEQMDKGLINPDEAEKSELKNMLTRGVGISPDVSVDITEIDLTINDFVLLCSDGLTKMVADDDILKVFNEQQDPDKITDTLIHMANEKGGRDNVTVVVAKVEETPDTWDSLADKMKTFFAKSDTSNKEP
jgi:PPM family protein phosphatase